MISAHHAQLILGLISNLETRSAFKEIFRVYKKRSQDAKSKSRQEDAKDSQDEGETPESPSKFTPHDAQGEENTATGFGSGQGQRKKRQTTLTQKYKKVRTPKPRASEDMYMKVVCI